MIIANTNFYHFEIVYVSRGSGEFVSRVASYIAGDKIYDKYYGLTHDFTSRTDILHKEILLPTNAPARFMNLETLVNEIEEAEKRFDARTAREVIVSLFNNHDVAESQMFTPEDYVELLRTYINKAFVSQGMCAFFVIHDDRNEDDPKKNNLHAHILLADRPMTKTGFCKKKNRNWNKRANVTLWRELWAEAQNKEFERKGLKIRVSAKSHIMLGIKREPTKHRGKAVIELSKRGVDTDHNNEYLALASKIQKDREEQKRQHKKKLEKSRERER